MAEFLISAFADEASDEISRQIQILKEVRIPCLEIRSVSGNITNKSDKEVALIARTLEKAGISVSAVGSPVGKSDITTDFSYELTRFRRTVDICKMLGTKRMRIFSFFVPQNSLDYYRDEVVRRLTVFSQEAQLADIQLCLENEALLYGQRPERAGELLRSVPGIYSVFDAANFILTGSDAMTGYQAVKGNLAYLHIKDASAAEQTTVPVGEGDGCYEEIIESVDNNSCGIIILTLEPHLHSFDSYASIDRHEMKSGRIFSNGKEAFVYAAEALKKLLRKLGFSEGENHIWKK